MYLLNYLKFVAICTNKNAIAFFWVFIEGPSKLGAIRPCVGPLSVPMVFKIVSLVALKERWDIKFGDRWRRSKGLRDKKRDQSCEVVKETLGEGRSAYWLAITMSDAWNDM